MEKSVPHINYLKAILLAAVSDGAIQPSELELMNKLKNHHPTIRKLSNIDAEQAAADVYNKLSAGMNIKYILEEMREELTEREQHAAYALAKEVIAADFAVQQGEKDFSDTLEKYWKIPREITDAINISIELRYFS